jgi:hypothetical protein
MKPYSERELIRIRREAKDEQTVRLLATIEQTRAMHVADLKAFQATQVEWQRCIAESQRREWGMVRILAAIASNGEIVITKEQAEKLQEGQRYEIIVRENGENAFKIYPLVEEVTKSS